MASLGSLLARLACRRSIPICGLGSMFAENPSPLPDATTDAMVVYDIFNCAEQKEGTRSKRESPSFQA
jgi:hypothetical protein